MLKKIKSFVGLIAILLMINSSVAAAPMRLTDDVAGNCSNLIKINNVKDKNLVTYDDLFLLEGSGDVNTKVTVYMYNKDKGYYDKCTILNSDSDNSSLTIGDFPFFTAQIGLKKGLNKLIVYAENNKRVQVRKVSIVLGKKSMDGFFDKTYNSFSDLIASK